MEMRMLIIPVVRWWLKRALQVFDCDFKRNVVRYDHSGNPLLLDDAVLLNVYRFTDAGADLDRLLIRVTVTRAAYDVVLPGDQAGLSRLEVNINECNVAFIPGYPVKYYLQGLTDLYLIFRIVIAQTRILWSRYKHCTCVDKTQLSYGLFLVGTWTLSYLLLFFYHLWWINMFICCISFVNIYNASVCSMI